MQVCVRVCRGDCVLVLFRFGGPCRLGVLIGPFPFKNI